MQVFDHVATHRDLLGEGQWDTSALHAAIKQIQQDTGIADEALCNAPRLDILMETGTGKTFTYLKTMYELNRVYGHNKFVIFVPRLAIRAGIIQNIDLTADYFFQEYGKRIKKHHYGDKSGLHQVEDYIRNQGEFSVLILTSASITGKNKRDRILARQNENLFGSQPPLRAISELEPIVFIDEPHLLKGAGFIEAYNKYFSNSLLLRFGATFPAEEDSKLSNVVYTLDSLTAFNDYLVKQISVSTITDENSAIKFYRSGTRKPPLTLNYFRNGIEYKTNIDYGENIATITGDKAHNFHPLNVKKNKVLLSNGKTVDLSSDTYTIDDDTMRIMVRETIRIHFEKEASLFASGIKALSLFFIPGIADFRGDDARVKMIFEEEYKKQRAKKLKDNLPPAYHEYLQQDYDNNKNLCIHEGYFAGDTGTKDMKESHGISLILNDKERLLSLDEPLRFIFSVWALQEGWDNPNIFTICKLAPTDRETTRRQQVGRGLRLAVDQLGRRQTIKYLQDSESSFYAINTLDVVVSGQEQSFIEGIQTEIAGASLTADRLTLDALFELKLSVSEATNLLVFLEQGGVIEEDKTTGAAWYINSSIADYLRGHQSDMPDNLKDKYDMLLKKFAQVPQTHILNRNKADASHVGIRTAQFQEFEDLWHTITRKAKIVYQHIDDDEIIAKIKADFDEVSIDSLERKIEKKTYNHKTNQVVFNKETLLGELDVMDASNYGKFVTDFSDRETLPLQFCLKLFNALDREKIAKNPKQAYLLITKLLQEYIHTSVIGSIDYKFDSSIAINARSIFYEDDEYKEPHTHIAHTYLGKYIDTETEPPENYLFDKIVHDSNIEHKIIITDPAIINIDGDDNQIVVYSKLPRISIPTPYKSYSPDFAYYIKTASGDKLYLVVETKGYDQASDIPEAEVKKISYGQRFFKALSQLDGVPVVEFKQRINKQELKDLLTNLSNERKIK